MSRVLSFSLLSLALAFTGCGGSGSSSPSPAPTPAPVPTAATTIKHIVIIMQENRTFDNLFMGYPGADTATSGMNKGQVVPLQPIPFEQGTDINHSHPAWYKAWDNGAMDDFSQGRTYPIPNLPYAYVPQSETVPYWTLAQHFTLGDRMFQSNTGPSYPAHQYMIAGQSADVDDNPPGGVWGCDAPATSRAPLIGPNGTDLPGVYPCFDYQTMGDVLDAKGVTWRYYTPSSTQNGYIWSAFDAIKHISFGADWSTNVISPDTQVLTDIANGQLAQVTWIVPGGTYSDHAGPGLTAEGPDWVATITNAIGGSQYWSSTAIFIAWDDWGGWYDHVNPPQVDNMGLGFRVPLIVVSPYAKAGYISHTTHEFSGFLKYTEEVFNLPSLGTRDVNADDFADCFNYAQTPIPYVPVPVNHYPGYFLKLRDNSPPDND